MRATCYLKSDYNAEKWKWSCYVYPYKDDEYGIFIAEDQDGDDPSFETVYEERKACRRQAIKILKMMGVKEISFFTYTHKGWAETERPYSSKKK